MYECTFAPASEMSQLAWLAWLARLALINETFLACH